MRCFHELLIDDYFAGNANRVGPSNWIPVMGNLDVWRFIVLVDRVSGTGLTLNMSIVDRPTMASDASFIPIIGGAALVAGQLNTFTASFGPNDAVVASSYGYALSYSIAGTSPVAHLRVWATGRGRA